MITLGLDIGGTSIKATAMRDGAVIATCRGASYERPDRAMLVIALRELLIQLPRPAAIGMCVPGLLDRDTRRVTASVNVPGLVNESLDAILAEAVGTGLPPATLLTDAYAAAHDLYTSRQLQGRLLLLALGTGVGASVLDPAGPLLVDGESPGHFGQLDVSLAGDLVIGPDGGAGGLEGYIGAATLHRQYGDDFATHLTADSPPLLALARAIRIGHAIYRPHHVCLAGGIGIALRPLFERLRERICDHLTSIARPDWTLTCADHTFHAATGAAKLAARGTGFQPVSFAPENTG